MNKKSKKKTFYENENKDQSQLVVEKAINKDNHHNTLHKAVILYHS